MAKDLKILIIGFGSIGQRHHKNLRSLGYENIFVFDPDDSRLKEAPKKLAAVNRGTLKEFDLVFICNPTSEHLKTAELCAEAGCHLFVEKPVSDKTDGLEKLEAIIRKNNLITMVGSNLRFHPAVAFIKNYLQSGRLGKVFSVSTEFGYYLPYWRPGTDYRENYAAKKETGGGIVLDDIHEFDLLFWLNDFQPVSDYRLFSTKISDLLIETEDQAAAVFVFKNKVIGRVFGDYLSKIYRRSCLVIGERGNLYWDWAENEVVLSDEGGRKTIFSAKDFSLNDMYLKELKYFMETINRRQKADNDIGQAAKLLRILLKNR
jgi:predicted dehydrogenase